MQFFSLTRPIYVDDHAHDRKNPVVSHGSHCLPGVVCEVCGSRWSSTVRLRIELPAPPLDSEFASVRFVGFAEWVKEAPRWAALLGLEIASLRPGAELGRPVGRCRRVISEDVVHPIPGEIWVQSHVVEALRQADLTGVSFAEVELDAKCGEVTLFELVVHGRASRTVTRGQNLELCETCHRRGFPSPKDLRVDESSWDGSDFFFVDHNPNIIIVTERAAEVFSAGGFGNVRLEPV